jgi:F-type H+-transporting ATPase subunit b
MEQTLQALGGILLKSIPTVVIVLLLHFYLKKMLFEPLDRVLKQRDDATIGARKAAEDSFANAEKRAAEYEAAIREARAEVYKEQEAARSRLVSEQDTRIQEARRSIENLVNEAKVRIEAETAAARRTLAGSAGLLADQITEQVLARRVS